jgi:hypothetical protein
MIYSREATEIFWTDEKEYLSVELLMQLNQSIDKMVRPWSNAKMLDDRCSGLFFNDVGRAALLAVIFGLAVALATGCSSMGGGLKAGLIAPVVDTQPGAVLANDGFYQPPRSPGFDDLTGS